jgi:DNA-binding transcriptional regulator YhcF (GntR family)
MELQRAEIITNKRGIGYFVAENASTQILEIRRREFFEQTLPEIVHQVELLKITKSDVKPLITKLEENENQ